MSIFVSVSGRIRLQKRVGVEIGVSKIMERHMGGCRICGEKAWVRNINLYYLGSEGLTVCEICEMNLIEHIRGMVLIAGIARKSGYRACRSIEKALAKGNTEEGV